VIGEKVYLFFLSGGLFFLQVVLAVVKRFHNQGWSYNMLPFSLNSTCERKPSAKPEPHTRLGSDTSHPAVYIGCGDVFIPVPKLVVVVPALAFVTGQLRCAVHTGTRSFYCSQASSQALTPSVTWSATL
jgi:hypothetical protein